MRKFLLLGFLCLTAAGSNRWDADGRAWWDNVAYLASDEMQGRNVGTTGFDRAANYVATQYERTGLKAVGEDGYFQRVWFKETWLVGAHMRLQRDGHAVRVSLPSDAQISFNAHSSSLNARIVFAGYGLNIPELDHDDFKNLPVKGAIVAFFAGEPAGMSPNLRALYASSDSRWQAMKAAGAIGMIAIPNPDTMLLSWERQTEGWGTSRMELFDPQMNRFPAMRLNATWNPTKADRLLAGSGHNFLEIVNADRKNSPLPHFVLPSTLKADMSVKTDLVPSKNVVAVQPGTDDGLKNQYVVVSAHLDHLGTIPTIGKMVVGDNVFNGAMDDASGVSSLIEIAKKLKNVRTKRSILFLAFTGEEKGELGSAYFAKHPPMQGHIVADLNMDMFLPLVPLKCLEVQGLDESTLGNDLKAVAEAAGVRVQSDSDPDKNRFTRSDQFSFVKSGVPALAFKFGYQRGDPEEKIFDEWYANRYHSVKDDATQPVDLNAAAQFNDILKSLLLRLADAEASPKWNEDSFFKRFAVPGL